MTTSPIRSHQPIITTAPRPPASRDAERAVDAILEALHGLADDVRVQTFSGAGAVTPPMIPAALARRGQSNKLLSGIVMLGTAFVMQRSFSGKPLPIPNFGGSSGERQNVIARIPPSGEARQTIVLVAHLNTEKQSPLPPSALRAINTAALILAVVGGVSLVIDAAAGRKRRTTIQRIAAGAALVYNAARALKTQNRDRVAGITALFDVAARLRAEPLAHTEVTLIVAESDGISAYLDEFAPPKNSTTFIDLAFTGEGALCYATLHGDSYLTPYRPAPRITALAARLGREASISGSANTTAPDDFAPLRQRGYEAICLADDPGASAANQAEAVPYLHAVITALDAKIGE